eukprot:6214127-Pleurochrysis_carterae.AAC.5
MPFIADQTLVDGGFVKLRFDVRIIEKLCADVPRKQPKLQRQQFILIAMPFDKRLTRPSL